jgi:hypothetical protein
MSQFGKTLFGGSRFIFWSLAPVLALCGVGLPFFITRWTATAFLVVASVEVLLVAFILALFDPRRFKWAVRCVTAVVFCACLAYAFDAFFFAGDSADTPSQKNAFMAFIAVGLPCLWYTLFGRFTRKVEHEQTVKSGEPKASEKLDAIDFDI